jgi:hypothetical protein
LVLKGICTREEWQDFKEQIYYDYVKDNNFTELRDAELLQNRVQTLQVVDPYVGRYFSAEWVRKNILQQTQEEIEAIDEQIKKESDAGTGGPTMPPEAQAQQQAMEQQYPPEDNTGAANESMTPMLDAEVEKYSALLNRR